MNVVRYCFAVLCLVSASCSTPIWTDKASVLDYTPTAILIVGSWAPHASPGEMEAMHLAMKTALQGCGIVSAVFAVDPLTLEPGREEAQLTALRRKIAPDLTFTYRETGGTLVGAGVTSISFKGTVFDRTNATVWQGHFDLGVQTIFDPTAGANAGRDLVKRFSGDGLIRSCPHAS